MSKYTEVLIHLKENICKNCCTWDKSLRNCDTCNVSVELESLEIADRLERVSVCGTDCCEMCKTPCSRETLCAEGIVWTNGYNQALTDIRGDNNGN